MWILTKMIVQLCLVVCFMVAVSKGTGDTAATGSKGTRKYSEGLAFSRRPSPRLCNQLCRTQMAVTSCKCPPKPEARPDPCLQKKCRRGSRCKAFGVRPVCLPMPRECLQPQVRGLCTGEYWRFHFNQRKNKCERFIFGGCSPNANNFNTLHSCQKICMAMHG